MSKKALKITFSGINTLTPAETGPETTVAHVVMGAWRTATPGPDGLPIHRAFVYVPEKYLSSPPLPVATVNDLQHGPTRIYYVDHARARVSPEPATRPSYFTDGKAIGERPGSDDVAVADDMRWLADLRDIVPSVQGFAPGCDPDQDPVNSEVAMVVTLHSGLFKANFPCTTVQPQAFYADGVRLDIPRRVYAQEFTVEYTYEEDPGPVRLTFEPLRQDTAPTGIAGAELVLQWENDEIELRMGNDTDGEIAAMIDLSRCDVPQVPVTRGNDFPIHYNLVNLDPDVPRPIPEPATLHTEHNGCLGVRTGG